jgi:nucleoside-diphosphate-sugar epimerase
MRILITGINGFVGNNLYDRFSTSNDIIGIDVSVDGNKHLCKTYFWNELLKLPEVDAIIHLAGIAHDTKGRVDESIYFDINVGLTQQIFDHFLKSSAQKFIFFSSVKAASDTINGVTLTENMEPNPKTAYGRSKLEAEKYIMGKSLPNEKFVYILRPAMIHGPGNKGNLNLLYSIIKRGIPYPLGAYHNARSFTSIGNLLFVLERLLESDIETGIYNMCDDESTSTSEIVQIINKSLGNANRIWNTPKTIIEGIAHLGGILHLPLNSERLKKMTESYVVSNHKVKKAIQVESLPIAASSGLSETLDSFKKI